MSQEQKRDCSTCAHDARTDEVEPCRGCRWNTELDSFTAWQPRADAVGTRQEPAGAPIGTAAIPAQPDPVPSANPAAWSLVMRDMLARDEMGRQKYGVRLQPGNGRDTLRDAYEEALDLAVYLRTAIYERDGK